jgi:hypothetical protein
VRLLDAPWTWAPWLRDAAFETGGDLLLDRFLIQPRGTEGLEADASDDPAQAFPTARQAAIGREDVVDDLGDPMGRDALDQPAGHGRESIALAPDGDRVAVAASHDGDLVDQGVVAVVGAGSHPDLDAVGRLHPEEALTPGADVLGEVGLLRQLADRAGANAADPALHRRGRRRSPGMGWAGWHIPGLIVDNVDRHHRQKWIGAMPSGARPVGIARSGAAA